MVFIQVFENLGSQISPDLSHKCQYPLIGQELPIKASLPEVQSFESVLDMMTESLISEKIQRDLNKQPCMDSEQVIYSLLSEQIFDSWEQSQQWTYRYKEAINRVHSNMESEDEILLKL